VSDPDNQISHKVICVDEYGAQTRTGAAGRFQASLLIGR
jgi:hypothetical protein